MEYDSEVRTIYSHYVKLVPGSPEYIVEAISEDRFENNTPNLIK